MNTIQPVTFKFLRNDPVRLSRYLPRFLYKDKTFADAQAALNWEHEHYRLKFIELARQAFIQTADRQGLLDWAAFLRIQSREDTEYLRNLIAQKRLGGRVLTPTRFIELMDSFLLHGSSFYKELGENLISIGFDNGTPNNWDDFWAALMEFLPAHIWLTDLDIEWHLDPHIHYLAQLQMYQGSYFQDLSNCNTDYHTIYIQKAELTAGRATFDIDTQSNTKHNQALHVAFHTLIHGKIRFEAENEIPDIETLEAFDRYLRQRWSEFGKNAVVRHYSHYFEPDFDIEDDDDVPFNIDFLKLYFNFPETKTLRVLTLLQPRHDIEGAEVNALSLVSKNMLLSRKGFFSNKIIRAVYVERESIRIL